MQGIERFTSRLFKKKEAEHGIVAPNEDVGFLLASGVIEQLVREGRIPQKIGPTYYQVPPLGYNPEDIDRIYMTVGGAYSFVYKDGTQRIGSTYTLSEEQARLLENRVAKEIQRITSTS